MPSRPTVLLTGGNAGIGYAAVVQLARAGAHVVIAARDPARGAAAVASAQRESGSAAVSLVPMDLSSRASTLGGVEAFRAAGHRRLDVLIHNAAHFDLSQRTPQRSADGVETVWATNHVGPVRLTQALEPELLRADAARVLTVASQGLALHPVLRVRLDDPEFERGGFRVSRAYYQSKLAQVMYTRWLAERYRPVPAMAACLRVTNVQVDLARYPGLHPALRRLYALKRRFAIPPEAMARVYTWLALAPEAAGYDGAYVDHRRRRVRAGRYAEDPAAVRAVMALTARYLRDGLAPLPA